MTLAKRPTPGPMSFREPWDRVAKGYAVEAVSVMLPFSRDAIALAAPSEDARVLDVACGSGMLALEIAPRVSRVDAVDFSPAMLAELEHRRGALGLGNVFAEQADGQALPFSEASFDAAFSMFGLMFFPDRARGFGELFRVLRPGGVAVVSSWAPVDRSPLMQLMFGALRAADPSRPAPETNLLSLENPDLFAEELEQAGFGDVKVAPHEHGVRVEDTRGFWDVMVRASAPLVMLKERLGPETWARQSAVAQAYIEQHLKAPAELTTTAFLGFARRPR